MHEHVNRAGPSDEVLASAAVVALNEAAAGHGVELPDPHPDDVAPRATVDPGELVGEAPHGWAVMALAPLDGGARTLGVGTVVETAGAARLAVAYVRARGWQAQARPHEVEEAHCA
ncbi:hypothetical protein [Kineococcus rhizosphaerae]|uniref:Uncharacterized protein n=1 Tax=Kineococcus rhizosphaerae TaxID=559628 RepID=A0A2T0QLN9_9ACTN|nr:hypothetical protein [Kineococcus rhizosphaerae]PRY05397.1 hypothetical protein CLV37_1399 [Kineococcus rhizosphaerae]